VQSCLLVGKNSKLSSAAFSASASYAFSAANLAIIALPHSYLAPSSNVSGLSVNAQRPGKNPATSLKSFGPKPPITGNLIGF
jgi:hypothetical protein